MKKLFKLIPVVALLAGVFGVAATRMDTTKAEAATIQTHRRIYATLKGDWTLDQMFISYWGGNTETDVEFENAVQMTQVVDDYNVGLFYYDVPIDHTTFLVRKNTGEFDGAHNQSVDISISSLFAVSNYYAAEIGGWVANGTKRTFTPVDTLPANSGQIAAILSHIDSCDSSYASGYNAWPQLNDLFVSPSDDANFPTYELFEAEPYNKKQPTISEKIAWLQAQYNLDQGITSGGLNFYNSRKESLLPIVLLGMFGFTSLGAVYFISKKKISN